VNINVRQHTIFPVAPPFEMRIQDE